MKPDELIAKNAELQKQLTPENDKYYGDLLVYLRAKGVFKNDLILEEKALEILQDILDAQTTGENAEAYFGKRPKEIADEILEVIPFNSIDSLKLLSYILGAYTLCSLFPALILPDYPLDLGRLGIVAVFSIAIAIVAFRFIGTSIYSSHKTLSRVLFGLLFATVVGGVIAVSAFIETPFSFQLVGIWGIMLIVLLILIVGVLFFRFSPFERKFWSPFLPLLTTCGIIGIFSRIAPLSAFFESKMGKYIVVGTLVLGLILQYLLIFLYSNKIKNSQNSKNSKKEIKN